MRDEYTPATPDHAQCPHCLTTLTGAPTPGRALVYASLLYHCGACGGDWSEARQPNTPPARHWLPSD